MTWPETIQVAADIATAAIEDLGRAKNQEATNAGREMDAVLRAEMHATHYRREEQRRKSLTELRAQEDLLLTAPPGTPGIEAALTSIREAKEGLLRDR